jgi:hypothetical protein
MVELSPDVEGRHKKRVDARVFASAVATMPHLEQPSSPDQTESVLEPNEALALQ